MGHAGTFNGTAVALGAPMHEGDEVVSIEEASQKLKFGIQTGVEVMHSHLAGRGFHPGGRSRPARQNNVPAFSAAHTEDARRSLTADVAVGAPAAEPLRISTALAHLPAQGPSRHSSVTVTQEDRRQSNQSDVPDCAPQATWLVAIDNQVRMLPLKMARTASRQCTLPDTRGCRVACMYVRPQQII
jgi:hypothetical protein